MDFLATLFFLLTLVFRGVLALDVPSGSVRKDRFLLAAFRFFPGNRRLSLVFSNDEFVFQRLSGLFFRFCSPIFRFPDGRLLFGRSPHFLMSTLAPCPPNVFRNR